MERLLKFVISISILLFLISACGSENSPKDTTLNDGAQNQPLATSDENVSANLEDERFQLEIISLEPDILSAGENLQISIQQSIDGEIFITKNGETIHSQLFSGAAANLKLPDNLSEGVYLVEIFAQGTRVGLSSFQISSGPGIWLSSDRAFSGNGTPVLLKVKSYRIPEEAIGAIYLSDQGGTSKTYIPDEQGYLIPGLPVPISEFLDQDLYLMNPSSATLQFKASSLAVALSDPNEITTEWESNRITTSECEQPSIVAGTLTGSGYVNVVWMNGQIQSNTVYTDSGSYQLEAGPGFVVIQTMSESPSGYQFDQQVLGATCGEEIQLTADLQIKSRKVNQPDTAQVASLDIAGIISGPKVHLASQGGQNNICRRGLVDSAVTINGQPDPDLTRAAGFALKAAIANTSPHISLVTQADLVNLIEAAARESNETGEPPNLDNVNSALTTGFLIRLTASTLGDSFPILLRSIPSQEGDQQLTISGLSSPEQLPKANQPIFQEFSEKFSHSAICGEVTPKKKVVALGEEVPLEYKLHELSGANADGAEVSVSEPECGALDPESGSIDGGIFKTTYKFPEDQFCTESLEFSATWEGPIGSVKTKPEEAISNISPQKAYMELSVGYVPGIGNQNANIVEVATFYEDWEEARSPDGLPPISQNGDCKYLDGGQPFLNQFWYQTVDSPGKRAESAFSTLAYSDLTNPINEYSDSQADHFLMRMQTYAYAVPVEDDTPAREASGYSGNGSIISMGIPSTIFIIDIYNPGELPVTPIINWNSRIHNDDGSYSGLIFYKIISCGTDAGLDSYSAFLSSNIKELYYFDSEEGGEPSGLETLPKITEKHTQLLLYIINYSIATSIRDDADGLYHSSMNKMTTEVDIYLSQEINSSE